MSIFLPSEVVDGLKRLKDNPDFTAFRAAFADAVHKHVHTALSAPPELRLDATSYARAARDLWITIEAAVLGQKNTQTPLPNAAPDILEELATTKAVTPRGKGE